MHAARPNWDEYFLAIAHTVATRADCKRARHGALIVSPDNRIISTGYNGSPPGKPGCLTNDACPRGNISYDQAKSLIGGYDDPESPYFCISVHAETNALLWAGRQAAQGATIYITGEPCHGCRKVIAASGVARVVYGNPENYTIE